MLTRVLGSIDDAEDALQQASERAARAWTVPGVPARPGAWLTTVAKRIALDELRRRRRHVHDAVPIEVDLGDETEDPYRLLGAWPDERLKLIFTCAHPQLSTADAIALTLREVAGLTTAQIARALLTTESTLAQRLVRAKRALRARKIPFEVPDPSAIDERLATVLLVISLIFNEGYDASSGDEPLRTGLCEEAIALARLTRHQIAAIPGLPAQPELDGLLALMLLTHARRDARYSNRLPVMLERQDRGRWRTDEIEEGLALLDGALKARTPGPFQIKAAIAAIHCQAATAGETDWAEIEQLYSALLRYEDTDPVRLNHAVATGMARGADEALARMDALGSPAMNRDPYFHAARAHFLGQSGREEDARAALQSARDRARNGAQRRELERRLREPTGD